MSDPVFSPDGQFMWTGTEWIPAPPNSSQSASVNLKDSVIGGDINLVTNVNSENQCNSCGSAGSVKFACVECKELCNCEICINEYKAQRTSTSLGEEPVFPGAGGSECYSDWDHRYDYVSGMSELKDKNYCHSCFVTVMDNLCNMRCKLCDRRYNLADNFREEEIANYKSDLDVYCWHCASYIGWFSDDYELTPESLRHIKDMMTEDFVQNFKEKVRQRSKSRFLNRFE
jgi:hypothetical protein